MPVKTLEQRIVIYILIPVFFILAGTGWASFLYARNAILEQWGETAIAKLQKASHLLDMRLSRAKNLLAMVKDSQSPEQRQSVQHFIVEQLRKTQGVVDVNFMENFQSPQPRYPDRIGSETTLLSTNFLNKNGDGIARIEVVISFQDLIDQISKTTWWKNNRAFLIDNDGNILARTLPMKGNHTSVKFAQTDPLEKKTMAALKNSPYGTIFGSGHPPGEISGYYHLDQAPWSLVLFSPGKQVLAPLLKLRTYSLVVGLVSIFGVLLFIRAGITRTTIAIKKVSVAAQDLANGIFGDPLPVLSKDEVGELTDHFNKMTKQLKERTQLKAAMSLAMEVQQSLLPPANFSYKDIEISACSVYCDETGGDYFDIIQVPDDPEKIYIAVGDVVGHGVGAALLMATTRGLLRSRVTQKGSLSEIVNDVNCLLCMDTRDSGRFVTLFLLRVDVKKGELQWVRAGHEPGMMYTPKHGKVIELKGQGLVLGLDEQWAYTQNRYASIPKGTVILIGTDGAWDVENKAGARLGKKTITTLLEQSNLLSSEKIVHSIILETQKFRGELPQNDDITLLVLKFL